MTFLRAVLNRSVVNDMTTQSLRELRTLSLLDSSRPVSKYDKWRRKSLTKAPEPPAVSMVSARLQGSPFGSSKRKNSRLVSEEDREHLRQILEKELEEKEQKAREPAEPAEHNPQPPVSTVSTISAPGFADDLKKPAVSVPPSTPPVSTVSTISGGGNPMKSVEMMETVESDASSVGSLPPLDSFLEDSAVKPEKPKISTVTTFSTIPNASNSMEEGQSSSDEERNAALLEQFEKEMGISGIPKKDPISQSLGLPDGMNEMGLYVDETPAPNPLERFQLMDCLVQLEETWKSEAAAKRPAPRYVQTSSYSRGSQPTNRRALSPALSSSRQPISRAPKEDSIRKGVSASKMPAAGKTAVSPKLGVASKGVSAGKTAVSPRLGVSSKAVSPKGTAGKTALRNSPASNSYTNGPNSYNNGPNSYNNGPNSHTNGPNSYNSGPNSHTNGPNASSPLKASNPSGAASSAIAGSNAAAAASKFSYFSSYGAASAASPALSASNPPKPASSASTNPMNSMNPMNPMNPSNSMNPMNPMNPSIPSIPSIPSGSLGPSLRSLDSGTLKKEPSGAQPRRPQFSPRQRAGKDPILSAVPGSPGSPGRSEARK